MSDPKRDIGRIRDTERWPARPWLPLVKRLDGGDAEFGLIHDEDVVADEIIRLFGTTAQSEQALMAGTPIDGSRLPLLAE